MSNLPTFIREFDSVSYATFDPTYFLGNYFISLYVKRIEQKAGIARLTGSQQTPIFATSNHTVAPTTIPQAAKRTRRTE